MKLSHTIQRIRTELVNMAQVSDAATADAMTRLLAVTEGAMALRLLELVTDLAGEVSAALPSGRIEVRLAGGSDPELVYVDSDPPALTAPSGDGDPARISLRLPQPLKDEVDRAAERDGVSVNTWIVSQLNEAVGRRSRSSGRRLSGYGKA
jgi:hypothetical protein